MELNAALVESKSQPCPVSFSWYKSVFVSLRVFAFHCMILRIPTQVLLHGGKTPPRRPKPPGMNSTEPDKFFLADLLVSGGLLGLLGKPVCLDPTQNHLINTKDATNALIT